MRDCKENGKDALQYDTLASIGEKMSSYCMSSSYVVGNEGSDSRPIDKALEQARRITTLVHPTPQDRKALQKWLIGPSMGNQFLNECEKLIWADENSNDVLTLMPPAQQDPFGTLLRDKLLRIYHALWGYRKAVSGNALIEIYSPMAHDLTGD